MAEQWKWAPVKRIKEAAAELKATIRVKYPDAQFRLSRAPDSRYGWHLWTTVDLEDPEELKELTLQRELDLLEKEHIPLYVITLSSDRTDRHLPKAVNGKKA